MPFQKLEEAIALALDAHRDQVRDGKAPLPYATHPIDVLNILRYIGEVTEESILIAALLHDLIEETTIKIAQIEKQFGKPVAKLVLEMTRTEPTSDQTAPLSSDEVWSLRNDLLLADIRQMTPAAQQIKLADRISNLRLALVTRTGKKRNRYIAQSKQILATIDRSVNESLWRELNRLSHSAKDSS